MLFELFYSLKEAFFGFNVFKYITFRAALAAITAFLISIIFGKPMVRLLKKYSAHQQIRTENDAPGIYDMHKQKAGTPTMGGILIVGALVIATLLWADLKNQFIIICLISTVWLGCVGFIDDFIKIKSRKSKGLGVLSKFTGQIVLGLGVAVYLCYILKFNTRLDLPFFKNMLIYLGIGFIPFVILVIVGTSNAVNLTDGLDGLAIGCVLTIALAYSGLSYVTGHAHLSDYLNIIYIPGASELTVFCAAIFGAGIGFLWFNSYPATIFMGDTGALALGGAIGVISVLIKKELLLVLVGGIFVFEALSVILQIVSVRCFKRRIFLMSPFHHHLQLRGWSEPKIIIRFWIVAIILALLSLATLKLR